jgi:hypothetical protein
MPLVRAQLNATAGPVKDRNGGLVELVGHSDTHGEYNVQMSTSFATAAAHRCDIVFFND